MQPPSTKPGSPTSNNASLNLGTACPPKRYIATFASRIVQKSRRHETTDKHYQGGRKQVVTPAGTAPWIPTPSRVDNTAVKAVVRAHRWRDILESGCYATVRDLAEAEAINESYLGRILRLTLLAPTMTEAILEGRQSPTLELDGLLARFPVEWGKQLEAVTER